MKKRVLLLIILILINLNFISAEVQTFFSSDYVVTLNGDTSVETSTTTELTSTTTAFTTTTTAESTTTSTAETTTTTAETSTTTAETSTTTAESTTTSTAETSTTTAESTTTSTALTTTTTEVTSTTSSSTTSSTVPLILELNSPNLEITNEKKSNINLTTNKKADEISYIDYEDKAPREKRLCSNCDEYGFLKEKFKLFNDGLHNLTFKAIKNNELTEEKILFLVDSKDPNIKKTSLKKGDYTNGTFIVEVDEENIEKVTLNFTSIDEKTSCPLDAKENRICEFNEDLSAFDGQKLSYWFEVVDKAGNKDKTKPVEVNVDTTVPVLTKVNVTSTGRRINFDIEVSEKVGLEYQDESEKRPRWVHLCSNCDDYNNDRSFGKGEHNITIKATDRAINIDEEKVTVIV